LDLGNFQHLLRHIEGRGDKGNKVLQILAGIALGGGKRRGLGCGRLAEKQNRRKNREDRKPATSLDSVIDARNSSHKTILWVARNIVERLDIGKAAVPQRNLPKRRGGVYTHSYAGFQRKSRLGLREEDYEYTD
jgi:hypothetical protein